MLHFLIILIFSTAQSLEQNEKYYEEMFIKPLPSGHVNTYFQFTTIWKFGQNDNLYNTHLFPRAISEILLNFDLKELDITLTQGMWRYESWAYPIVNAAPGAEARAWFSGTNLTSDKVDVQWAKLASTFSGILCASLNFIDGASTVSPKYSFRPKFGISPNDTSDKFLRYSTLPREIVCTENLTPWKKLLPCNSKNGFVSLLNSGFVHNTNYHSLGINVRTYCETFSAGCILEFTQTANLVYDLKMFGSSGFSLRRLFGQGLNGACSLASSSKIYVDTSLNKYDLIPEPEKNFTSMHGGFITHFAMYDIQKQNAEKLFNIAWNPKDNSERKTIKNFPPPPLYAHRYVLGHGQERGQIVTQIFNNHWAAMKLVFQENIPWFVPSYMHTLKIVKIGSNYQEDIKAKDIYYVPGEQRKRPYHLEIVFEIPAKSAVQISFNFDYIFLKWLEYPPDASHGFNLGSAIITAQMPIGKNYTAIPIDGYLFAHSINVSHPIYLLQIRTESLVLSLPTPDFSMPYNVICLACTVVALAFGPIHSVATKRIVIERKDKPQSYLGKIKEIVCSRLRKKNAANTAEEKLNCTETDSIDDIQNVAENR